MNDFVQSIQCFGPVSYFSEYKRADIVWIEMHENYQKRSWRNRYRILSSSGPETWSIPLVKGKNDRQSIQEVQIAYDEDWIPRHLHAIRSAYGKSPYFDDIFPDLTAIFEKRYRFLWDMAMESQLWALRKINLPSEPLRMTQAYHKTYDDLKDYRHNGSVSERKNRLTYNQVWEERYGFVEDLSILDVLFCTGPEAMYYL
jgi:hypothetical protein